MSSLYTCVPKITRHTGYFVILGHFFPFYSPPPLFLFPPKNPANQKFEKMKNMPGEIIILHTKNHQKSQSYDVCFLRYGREFVVILDHFLSCYPSMMNPEDKEFEKMKKKCLEISSFYTCVSQITII